MVFGYFTKKYNEKLIESLPRSSSWVSRGGSLLESGLSYNPDRTRSVSVGIIGD